MNDLPYYEMKMLAETRVDNAVNVVEFTIDGDEFRLYRDAEPGCPERYPEVPVVDLTFGLVTAIRLRDFLNFALPVDLVKADEI